MPTAPKWYSQYRFYLSILVGTCIIGSLAATSYWGPVGGHGITSHDLNMVSASSFSLGCWIDVESLCRFARSASRGSLRRRV